MTPNTDAPSAYDPDDTGDHDDDSLDAAEDDTAYTKLIHLSLCNCNINYKIVPNTKKTTKRNITPNTYSPNADAPDAAKYDTTYPSSLRNRKKKKCHDSQP